MLSILTILVSLPSLAHSQTFSLLHNLTTSTNDLHDLAYAEAVIHGSDGAVELLEMPQSAGPTAQRGDVAAPAGFRLDANRRTIGGVGYVPPNGWNVTENSGMVIMTKPVPQRNQPCVLVIDPNLKPVGDMAGELEGFVDGSFGSKFGQYQGENGGDLKASRYEGVSIAGWPYVDLLGQLGNSGIHVRALLARFNDRAVALMGSFKSVDCLGSYYVRDNDTFLMLFHSLRLPGFDGTSPDFAKQLLGSWQSATSSAGVRVTYAANGQFDDGAVKANYYVGGNGLIYDVASHFVGNGTYYVDGDRLTMIGHDATRMMLFSVVHRPRRDRPGEYDEILRRLEPTNNQVWGFARTGYYVMTYSRMH